MRHDRLPASENRHFRTLRTLRHASAVQKPPADTSAPASGHRHRIRPKARSSGNRTIPTPRCPTDPPQARPPFRSACPSPPFFSRIPERAPAPVLHRIYRRQSASRPQHDSEGSEVRDTTASPSGKRSGVRAVLFVRDDKHRERNRRRKPFGKGEDRRAPFRPVAAAPYRQARHAGAPPEATGKKAGAVRTEVRTTSEKSGPERNPPKRTDPTRKARRSRRGSFFSRFRCERTFFLIF